MTDETTGEMRRTPIFSRAFWRTTAALACFMLVASLMNIVVFPLYDGVFTYARDISQTMQVLALLVVGIVATFWPKRMADVPLPPLGVLLLACGAPLTFLALTFESAVLLVVGSSLFAAGRGVTLIAVSLALARSMSSKEEITAAVALAIVSAAAIQAICWVVPIAVGMALYFLLPFAILALTWHDARAVIQLAIEGEAPVDASVTRPKSFLPLASQLFVCLFMFRVAFGISLRFGESTGVPVAVFFGIAPIGLAALLLVCWKWFDVDRLAQFSVLFVMVGFLYLNSSNDLLRNVSNVLLSSGNTLFNMVSWIVIVSVAARNLPGALSVVGWGNGVASLGTILGATIGVTSNHLVEDHPEALMALSGVLLILFVGYALVGLKSFSFREVIEGVVPVETPDVVAESPEDLFQARCDALAEQYRLTPREREVFAMLARGRNREYIQEALVVSRGTVKTHVRHIYEKLGTHSHQELIDLVER